MKVQAVLCLLIVVGCAWAEEDMHPRGCIYALGKCVEDCPVGTHAYTTGCGKLMPEPTCDTPNPVPPPGDLCDYSACYCDPPTVRDTTTKTCVKLEDCPKKLTMTLRS